MDKAICSLLEVSLSSKLHTINLHCNNISKIEGLCHLLNLRHLDLSSNQISQIEGLNTLANLCTLNLACNFITKVEGLEKLLNLTRLNLSYNHIHDLQGFLHLRGTRHKISHIDLHSNYISNIHHLLQCMVGLHFLTNLTLEKNGKSNPICDQPGYRGIILQTLPQLTVLDGMNIFGEPVNMAEGNPSDLQCLESLLDNLVYSDSQLNEEKNPGNLPGITLDINQEMSQDQKPARIPTDNTFHPFVEVTSSSEPERNKLGENNLNSEMRIKKLEDQISQLLNNASNSPKSHTSLKVFKLKRETTMTSESDYESGKENHKKVNRKTKIPHYSKAVQTSKHRNKSKLSDSGTEQSCTKKSKDPSTKNLSLRSSSRNSDLKMEKSTGNLGSQGTQTDETEDRPTEESTYRTLVQELDEEREKRWKAEQAEKKLADHIKELQKQAKEEKDIHSMALFTTERLKELILKERNAKAKLQTVIQKFKSETEKLNNELSQSRNKEEEQNRVLRTLEQTLSKMEKQKAQQQVAEMKRIQEVELKASASEREIQLLRASLHQQKEKVQQLHELLAMKEQEHRKELETRVTLNGSDFQDALAKEIGKEEKRHEERVKEFQERINILNQRYLELEDEFRMALIIEAKRFKEVKDGFENISAELAKKNHALARAQEKENKSSALIQDLTSMVKEQKTRIAEVSKAKLETTTNLKNRIRTLETMIEEDKQKSVQIELLKQEKSQLISQLTAQESTIDGLRAERKMWGQELTQQGASLAQDYGKLEAKIEVLTTENESLRKLSARESDSLKIKVKIIEDQTETIRKLKESLQERDEHIRKLREETIEMQKNTQEQLDDKAAQLEELMEKLERHCERKEDLKQQLKEKQAELEEIGKAYSAINKKWQDKGELLSGLEAQVKQMKEKFETKEKKLIEERDKSLQNQKATMERLHSMDDNFRKQLESMVAAHQAELLQLTNEKQNQIDAANEKVSQVEDEMRQLLHETAQNKKIMEEKIKRLTFALSDVQQEFWWSGDFIKLKCPYKSNINRTISNQIF
ncbi:LOW QUALITY PROTEIN: leucine-rich repeat and coiled-coil domain-containing protein 1-like [Trichosurus vulpecula]|uniref:LOW QUALITY PROTEIN: leucine-rich repeat and coiled-coil domain-containing protein 1-like n=1 Tax=Trichosurus vulpecula TaxID=9337 RepID=UPI00186B5131|nr:LOW QUALITY PROTEIN: leucine-rich repeat and coiled-coil domain-containing protein 1-like [Trichosurus vulpecula]